MRKHNIGVYYFNTSDYHMSEYVPEYFKTIRYFSGFTGSLATLLVDLNSAYIFVDGRYFGQADNECLKNDVEVIKLGTADALEPIEFIEKFYKDKTVGIDARRTGIGFAKSLIDKNIDIECRDIYSDLIEGRTALSDTKIRVLDIEYTGKTAKEKIKDILESLNGKVHIVNNLESIAYTLNLRADDIIHTPVFMSYMVFMDDCAHLFVNTERLTDNIRRDLADDGVMIHEYDEYYDFLKTIKNKTVTLDENKVNYETYRLLSENNNTFINERSVIENMKAIKNETEIKNIRIAQEKDGVAMVRFLKWINETDVRNITEYDAAMYVNAKRYEAGAFDLSFEPIVAYNANAAMMHYSPSKENSAKLDNKGMLLIDSGGQYLNGTTDITRTIALGETSEEVKKHFTIVLKSMFNLSSVTFLSGMSGKQLDVLARKDVWNELINYRCGTGHGVGHVLSVHENPPNVRFMGTGNGSEDVALVPGHYFSDEPGIYLEGKYGIRCENMLFCKVRDTNEYGTFLNFEHMTLCPFDLKLIDKKYLDEATISELNAYHKMVYERLSKYLNDEEREFLKEITRSI